MSYQVKTVFVSAGTTATLDLGYTADTAQLYFVCVPANTAESRSVGTLAAWINAGKCVQTGETTFSFSGATAGDYTVFVSRKTDPEQLTPPEIDGTVFPTTDVIDGICRLIDIVAELQTESGRAIKAPEPDFNAFLPTADQRAGKIVGFDNNGDLLVGLEQIPEVRAVLANINQILNQVAAHASQAHGSALDARYSAETAETQALSAAQAAGKARSHEMSAENAVARARLMRDEAASSAAESTAAAARAQQSAIASDSAKTTAQTAADTAEAAATRSRTAADASSDSANEAAVAASAADDFATTAGTKAGEASASATQAGQSATQAGQSATNAQGYADNASASATQAGQSATSASQSANDAQGYANNASASATSASGSATSAQGYANNASASATQAQASATEASNLLAAVNRARIISSDESLEDYAYAHDRLLESYTNTSATQVGERAFYYCTALATLRLTNATTIGNNAFCGCTALTTITDLSNATTIGSFAFSECTALTTITDLSNATTIGKYAFHGCRNLSQIGNTPFVINLPKLESWGRMAFYPTYGFKYSTKVKILVPELRTMAIQCPMMAFPADRVNSDTAGEFIYPELTLADGLFGIANSTTTRLIAPKLTNVGTPGGGRLFHTTFNNIEYCDFRGLLDLSCGIVGEKSYFFRAWTENAILILTGVNSIASNAFTNTGWTTEGATQPFTSDDFLNNTTHPRFVWGMIENGEPIGKTRAEIEAITNYSVIPDGVKMRALTADRTGTEDWVKGAI